MKCTCSYIHENFICYVKCDLLYESPSHFLKLARQEEELRLEEEKFYEAKREAARIAKLQKKKEQTAKSKNATTKGGKSWLGEDENEWDM